MRRLFLLSSLFAMLPGITSAQAYEGNIQYEKKKQAAIVIEYRYPPEAVENAITQRLGRLGFRAKEEKGFLNKDKGFLVFKNAIVTEITDQRLDYIVKVERKSRKDNDESILYLILAKGDDNALQKLEAYDVGRAKTFLNDLLPDIEEAHLELQIKEQEEIVSKAEKKLKDLESDKTSLERKLEDNIKEQEATQREIEAQRKSLEILTGKRRKT